VVHRLETLLADLRQVFERIGAVGGRLPRPVAAPADGAGIDALDQGRNREMFFERNDTHGRRPPMNSSELSHPMLTSSKRGEAERRQFPSELPELPFDR